MTRVGIDAMQNVEKKVRLAKELNLENSKLSVVNAFLPRSLHDTEPMRYICLVHFSYHFGCLTDLS